MAVEDTTRRGKWQADGRKAGGIFGASVVALTGLAVIVGWLTKNLVLIQVLPGMAPMKFNTAVSFLACGLALCLSFRDSKGCDRLAFRRKFTPSFLLSLIPLALGGLTVAEHLLHRSLGIDTLLFNGYVVSSHAPTPGRISLLSAICLTLIAFAIQLRLARWSSSACSAASGLLSVIVLVTGILSLIRYASHISFSYTFGEFSHMAFHTSACFVILSAILIELAHRSITDLWRRTVFVAIGVAIFGLLVTIVTWQAQESQQLHYVRAITASVSDDIGTQLATRVQTDAGVIRRLGERCAGVEDGPNVQWQSDAKSCRRDFPEFRAIAWVEPDLRMRWSEPAIDWGATSGRAEQAKASAMARAVRTRAITMSDVVDLPGGGHGFVIYSPVTRSGKFIGLIAGVCRLPYVVRSIGSRLLSGYAIDIIQAGRQVYSTDDADEAVASFTSVINVEMFGNVWTLKVAPTALSANAYQSALPRFALIVGFALTGLAVATILLMGAAKASGDRERSAKALATSISDNSTNHIFVVDLPTRMIVYANATATEGITRAASKGTLDLDRIIGALFHPDDQEFARSHYASFDGLEEGGVVEYECRIRSSSGDWRWMWIREVVLTRSEAGTPVQVLGTGTDVTARREADEAIRENSALLENAIDQSPIGMALVAPDGRWLRVNDAICDLVGYERNELLACDFQTITHPDDLEADLHQVGQLIAEELTHYSMEKRYLHKDGRIIWVLLSVSLVRKADGSPAYFVSQIQDISMRKEAAERLNAYAVALEFQKNELELTNVALQELATTDSLTGASNRRALFDFLGSALSAANRYRHPVAVIMMDVDHFKAFNDQFGHLAGDDVLRRVALILADEVRECDLVARYGGEEFVVVCPQTTIAGAALLAERMRVKVEQFAWQERKVTASFGIAALSAVMDNSEQLLAAADTALYASKAAGRNRVTHYDELPSVMKHLA